MAQAGASGFELIMRAGVDPKLVVGKKVPPPPDFTESHEQGLHIERLAPAGARDPALRVS